MYCDIRASEVCEVKDYASNSIWINMGVKTYEPKFTDPSYSRSLLFEQGTYLYTANGPKLTGLFTICLWHKFTDSTFVKDDNHLILMFDDNSKIDYILPSSLTGWNHICFVRDTTNTVTLRINGTTVYSVTNTATIDFNNVSCLYIGNENKYTYGYNSIVDELIIIDDELFSGDYTVLDFYMILGLYVAYKIATTDLFNGYRKK